MYYLKVSLVSGSSITHIHAQYVCGKSYPLWQPAVPSILPPICILPIAPVLGGRAPAGASIHPQYKSLPHAGKQSYFFCCPFELIYLQANGSMFRGGQICMIDEEDRRGRMVRGMFILL